MTFIRIFPPWELTGGQNAIKPVFYTNLDCIIAKFSIHRLLMFISSTHRRRTNFNYNITSVLAITITIITKLIWVLLYFNSTRWPKMSDSRVLWAKRSFWPNTGSDCIFETEVLFEVIFWLILQWKCWICYENRIWTCLL